MRDPLPLLTKRPSMVSEVVRTITGVLAKGEWADFLPAERELCDLLGVSRSTLRLALNRLQTAGHIKVEHGKKTRILNRTLPAPGRVSSKQRTIVVLTASTNRNHLQSGAFWLDEFRQMSAKIGLVVVYEFIPQSTREGLRELLNSLRDKYHPSVWLLVASDRKLHEILSKLKWPTVLGGTVYPDLPLPSVDSDHRAACRHAVGHLASIGHRRIGLVIARLPLPGDSHSIEGFEEGLAMHRGEPIEGVKLFVESWPESVFLSLRREYQRPHPATALISCRPQFTLSTLTVLAALGRVVPRDVSLVAREYNSALMAPCWPTLASYQYDPAGMARKTLSLCRKLIAGETLASSQFFFMPTFVPGASLRTVRSKPGRS